MANRIELFLADEDPIYLEKLALYLMERKNMFQLHTFSDRHSLERALTDRTERIDILAVSEYMDSATVQQSHAKVKIVLTEDDRPAKDGSLTVSKFQKTEKLTEQLLQAFQKQSGQLDERRKAGSDAVLIGVYSPIGGSGKTTLAVLLARAFATLQLGAFYCDMERITALPQQTEPGKSLSHVLLALQTKGADLQTQIRNNTIRTASGILTFAAPESTLEWNEVDPAAIERLIQALTGMEGCDAVIVDLDSELNADKLRLLSRCDAVLMPVTGDATARRKASALKEELDLHAATYSVLASRIVCLENKGGKDLPNSVPYDAAYTSLADCMSHAPIPQVLIRLAQRWKKR